MKKVIFSIIAAASTLFATAAPTAIVKITLTGNSGGSDELTVCKDAARNATYESGYDSENMMSLSNSYSVLIYSYVGSQPCSAVYTNDVDEMAVGFTTNNVDANYTLSFNYIYGTEEMTFTDVETGTTFAINASTPDYNFTATAGQVATPGRFIINHTAHPEICHRFGKLQITDCVGMTVKVLNMDGSATSIADTNITAGFQEISLAGLAAGQYKVEWNSQTLIIDVK